MEPNPSVRTACSRKPFDQLLSGPVFEGKIIGWHNFRQRVGTLLRAIGTDIKVAQDLLRHANSRTTLDIYPHAVLAAEARRQHQGSRTSTAGTGIKGSAPFSTFAPLKRRGLGVEVVHLDGVVGGPDRDRTDDLFHAMEARSQLRHRPTLRKDSFYSG